MDDPIDKFNRVLKAPTHVAIHKWKFSLVKIITALKTVYCKFLIYISALTVRFLTRRFIGEYDSHAGKNIFY